MSAPQLFEHIKKELAAVLNTSITTMHKQRVYGGDINETFIIKTNTGNFFIKANSAEHGDMFEKESAGLAVLKQAVSNFIPAVYLQGSFESNIFLVLENIEHGPPSANLWRQFALNLATLHQHSNGCFGLNHDNYIGSIPQKNTAAASWAGFYAENRLMHLTAIAAGQKMFSAADVQLMEILCGKLQDIFPPEAPSLLHGDLWSGNYLVNQTGHAMIFDPAVYYGHREMDIAMTLLFGGFDKSFYDSYDEIYPLEKNWRQRVEVCQLYPLMVHLILFGGHYYQQVKNILTRYQ